MFSLHRETSLFGKILNRPLGTVTAFALLVSLVALVSHARIVIHNMDTFRSSQKDNVTWVVAQLEVDFQRLLLAMQTARVTDPVLPDAAEEVRRRFDVYFSRVLTVSGRIKRFEGGTAAESELLDRMAGVQAHLEMLADAMDQSALASAADVAALQALAVAITSELRWIALTSLQVMVANSSAELEAQERLLNRFLLLSIFLVALMATVAALTFLLSRQLNRRTQDLLRVSSNLSRTIEASLDAVIVTDADGKVLEYNQAAETIFGYSSAEAKGQTIGALFVPDEFRGDAARVQPFLLRARSSHAKPGRIRLTSRHKSGRSFPVEVAIVSDTDSDARPIFIGFVRDISGRIDNERKLRDARTEAERSANAKARFLAVMSHEMRTPLHGVIASLDLVPGAVSDDERDSLLRIARNCADTALDQVEDVLDITQLESTAPQAEAFDAGAMIRDVVEQSLPLAHDRGNRLQAQIDSAAEGPVLGNRRAFRQAVLNLVANAGKFTTGGAITVRLLPDPADPAMLRIEVQDTGIGIDPADQSRIFDDFETLTSGYARSSTGTGLGLGIVRRAVQAMDGRLGLQSTPGLGSTFWFTLPWHPAPQQEKAALAAPAETVVLPQNRPLRTLVSDDNPVNREVMGQMLRRLGHSADLVADGPAAVRAAGKVRYDLILMDISMPGMDGLEATRQIRQGGASADSPVLGVTANAMADDLARFRAEGMEAILTKPVTLAALADRLRGFATGPAPATDPEDALIAVATFAEVQQILSAEDMARLLQTFLQETRAALALAQKSPLPVGRSPLSIRVHSCAGSAALFGALRLQKLLCRIEDALQAGQTEGLDLLLTRAEAALNDTAGWLDEVQQDEVPPHRQAG